MITVHVTNLDKYLPGYKDRALSWFKVYFRNSLDGDSRFKSFFDDEVIEGLEEADRYRYLSLIAMEAQLGRPVPLDAKRLAVMGWNTKKRPIKLTLNVLQGLVEVCTWELEFPVPQSRERVEREEEKETRSGPVVAATEEKIHEAWNTFAVVNCLPVAKVLNAKRHAAIRARLTEPEFKLDEIMAAIKQSDFLLGRVKDWRVDFDFVFCSAHNYIKILEGKYQNGPRSNGKRASGYSGYDASKYPSQSGGQQMEEE